MTDINRLLDIMAQLRNPDGGCPWDLEQTYQTIVPHTLEEAYEVAETIEKQDYDSLVDELGDLLFQIVFYAQLGKEEKRFGFDDVVNAICDKLVRRHPHVFADHKFDDAQQQTRHWEELKKQERLDRKASDKEEHHSELDGITRSLPALSLARKIQSRAARVGFDWPDEKGVFEKLDEEISEVKQAWPDQTKREEEIGDVLFTCVNLCRHAEVDPEQGLRLANQKFENRFRSMESQAQKEGAALNSLTPDELEARWQQVK